MNESMHSPSPEFRAFLEYEVVRAARQTSTHRRARGWARVAVLVLVCVGVGMTTAFASAQMRDGARRDSLLESARADLQIAGVRLELAQAQYNEAGRQSRLGAASALAAGDAEADLRAAEAQAMRARYNIEEITQTAQPPRDDLNAPLVGARDFVRDRLQLEAMAAQKRLAAAEANLGEAERKVRVGAVDEGVRLEAEQQVATARAAFAVLAEKLQLRKQYLEKQTPVDSLLARLAYVQLRSDAVVAQSRLNIARERYDLLKRRQVVGAAQDLDLLKAQVEMQEAEIELQRLAKRLQSAGSAKPEL